MKGTIQNKNLNTSQCTVAGTGICYGRKIHDFIPSKETDFSPIQHVQTNSTAHPTYYSMGTKGSFPKCKVPEL